MSNTTKTKLKKVNDQNDPKTSTPKQAPRIPHERDYSPAFLPCTQESMDGLDVMWDWNSPQSRNNYTRKTKRTQKLTSPKLPHKKNASDNLRVFNKLKEELEAFQEDITVDEKDTPDHELVIDKNSADLEEFFNDSIELDMVLASQQIEQKLEVRRDATPIKQPVDLKLKHQLEALDGVSPIYSKAKASPRNLMTKSFSSNELESPVRKMEKSRFSFKSRFKEIKESTFNDSFDVVLENFDEPLEVSKSAKVTSECDKTVKEQSVGMLKLKTKSLSFGDHYANIRSSSHTVATKAEIERKRLEAMAKLRAKKKTDLSDSDTSPIKCSPEEIALKRQQALAKLEAKKQQDVIERNRQEALKRLEMNRKKRAEANRKE